MPVHWFAALLSLLAQKSSLAVLPLILGTSGALNSDFAFQAWMSGFACDAHRLLLCSVLASAVAGMSRCIHGVMHPVSLACHR